MKTDAFALFFFCCCWNTWDCAGFTFSPSTRIGRVNLLAFIHLNIVAHEMDFRSKNWKKKTNRKMEAVQVKSRPLRLSATQFNSLVTILFFFIINTVTDTTAAAKCGSPFSVFRSFCNLVNALLFFSFHLFCHYFHDLGCCFSFVVSLRVETSTGARARARSLQLFWASISRMASETT